MMSASADCFPNVVDKTSSAELTESINSMFQWYEQAVVCYVLLEDLDGIPTTSWLSSREAHEQFRQCRWFSRGWTLQELIAPRTVKFFNRVWDFVCTKSDHADIISDITNIPARCLLKECSLSRIPIAARMSWAAGRKTKRTEDVAYCLLGIFDVNMPLIYGEGMKAFRRLQEEVIKHSNDMSIFAWDPEQNAQEDLVGILASSPIAFAAMSSFVPCDIDSAQYSITNQGLLFTGDFTLQTRHVTTRHIYLQTLYMLWVHGKGIYLRKLGPQVFCRVGTLYSGRLHEDSLGHPSQQHHVTSAYVLTDPQSTQAESLALIAVAIKNPFRLDLAIPKTLWNDSDKYFFNPKRLFTDYCHMVLALRFKVQLMGHLLRTIIVLCDHRSFPPKFRVFDQQDYPRPAKTIFQLQNQEESISWEDLDNMAPELMSLSHSATVIDGIDSFRIDLSCDLNRLGDRYSFGVKTLTLSVRPMIASRL
jgi:hypothetical protein